MKNLNELKKRVEAGGEDWTDALVKIKEATGGKDIAVAMKDGWTIDDFAKLLLGNDGNEEKTQSSSGESSPPSDYSFTEAPASFNVKAISSQGFDVMLTLRDADTKALMDRAQHALAWLAKNGYQPTGRRSNSGNSPPANNQGEAPLCPTHNKSMLPSKHGGWYCPVKIADDDGTGKPVYCKQRVK